MHLFSPDPHLNETDYYTHEEYVGVTSETEDLYGDVVLKSWESFEKTYFKIWPFFKFIDSEKYEAIGLWRKYVDGLTINFPTWQDLIKTYRQTLILDAGMAVSAVPRNKKMNEFLGKVIREGLSKLDNIPKELVDELLQTMTMHCSHLLYLGDLDLWILCIFRLRDILSNCPMSLSSFVASIYCFFVKAGDIEYYRNVFTKISTLQNARGVMDSIGHSTLSLTLINNYTSLLILNRLFQQDYSLGTVPPNVSNLAQELSKASFESALKDSNGSSPDWITKSPTYFFSYYRAAIFSVQEQKSLATYWAAKALNLAFPYLAILVPMEDIQPYKSEVDKFLSLQPNSFDVKSGSQSPRNTRSPLRTPRSPLGQSPTNSPRSPRSPMGQSPARSPTSNPHSPTLQRRNNFRTPPSRSNTTSPTRTQTQTQKASRQGVVQNARTLKRNNSQSETRQRTQPTIKRSSSETLLHIPQIIFTNMEKPEPPQETEHMKKIDTLNSPFTVYKDVDPFLPSELSAHFPNLTSSYYPLDNLDEVYYSLKPKR